MADDNTNDAAEQATQNPGDEQGQSNTAAPGDTAQTTGTAAQATNNATQNTNNIDSAKQARHERLERLRAKIAEKREGAKLGPDPLAVAGEEKEKAVEAEADKALAIPAKIAGKAIGFVVGLLNKGNEVIGGAEQAIANRDARKANKLHGKADSMIRRWGRVEASAENMEAGLLKAAEKLEARGGVFLPWVLQKVAGVVESVQELADSRLKRAENIEARADKLDSYAKGWAAMAESNEMKRDARSAYVGELKAGNYFKGMEMRDDYKDGRLGAVLEAAKPEIDPDELERRKRAAEKAAGVDAAAKDKPTREVDATALDGATDPRYVETRRGASPEEIEKISGIIETLKEEFKDLELKVDKNNNVTITGLSKAACLALDKMYEASGIEPPVDMTAGKQIDNYKAEKAKKAVATAPTQEAPADAPAAVTAPEGKHNGSPAQQAAGVAGVDLTAGNQFSDLPLSKTETKLGSNTKDSIEVGSEEEFRAEAARLGVRMDDKGVGDKNEPGGGSGVVPPRVLDPKTKSAGSAVGH